MTLRERDAKEIIIQPVGRSLVVAEGQLDPLAIEHLASQRVENPLVRYDIPDTVAKAMVSLNAVVTASGGRSEAIAIVLGTGSDDRPSEVMQTRLGSLLFDFVAENPNLFPNKNKRLILPETLDELRHDFPELAGLFASQERRLGGFRNVLYRLRHALPEELSIPNVGSSEEVLLSVLTPMRVPIEEVQGEARRRVETYKALLDALKLMEIPEQSRDIIGGLIARYSWLAGGVTVEERLAPTMYTQESLDRALNYLGGSSKGIVERLRALAAVDGRVRAWLSLHHPKIALEVVSHPDVTRRYTEVLGQERFEGDSYRGEDLDI